MKGLFIYPLISRAHRWLQRFRHSEFLLRVNIDMKEMFPGQFSGMRKFIGNNTGEWD